jgi:hypothetical protein
MSRLDTFVLVVGLANLVAVIEFVRRRRLMETFALLWISVGALGVVAAVARPLIDDLSHEVGIEYGTSFVLAAVCAFLLFVCMSLSLHVSRLERRTEVLAEEVAFLKGVEAPPEDAPR